MQIYIVGGFVRDKLLNLEAKDKDFVVIGSSEKEMLNLGYIKVGSDFPVFLHPITKDEYALARTERKIRKGYFGFEVQTQNVSLKDDLMRRDLTINALAMNEKEEIFDYFNGLNDLQNKILRHISNAFCEDPLRVLRVCRFAAKFHYLDFKIATDTLQLMQNFSKEELNALSYERIYQEFLKANFTNNPEIFYENLEKSLAMQKIFPEIIKSYQTHKTNINRALRLTKQSKFAFIAFLVNLNLNNDELKTLCNKLTVDNKSKELALFLNIHKEIIINLELFQKTKSLHNFSFLAEICDYFYLTQNIDIKDKLQTINEKLKTISMQDIDKHLQGKAIGLAILHKREEMLKTLL